MKRVLTIQDISCVGKCSLTVALPTLSAMGLETAILPTALLSTHTGFSSYSFLDLTAEISKISSQWKSQDIAFEGIYSGFLGSFEQLGEVAKILNSFAPPLALVDPCMGDNGKLYPCFDASFVRAMRALCAKADIITPNITEAAFMCDMAFRTDYDTSYIDELLARTAILGAKRIVLKGVSYDEKTCGVIALDTETGVKQSYFHELLPLRTSGTGDIFASVLFGSLVLGDTIEVAIKRAADFVVASIKESLKDSSRTWYGVQFEKILHTLAR